jgi:hypothetical protein
MLSLEGDVATVRATLDRIPGPKLLVGHSYVDIPEWSVRLLFLPRHCLSLLRMQASDYGAGRFPPAGLIPWRGDRRWTDLPAAVRPHPRVGIAVQQWDLVPRPHPPRHDIQPR